MKMPFSDTTPIGAPDIDVSNTLDEIRKEVDQEKRYKRSLRISIISLIVAVAALIVAILSLLVIFF